jgi:hypothetical protein
VDEPVVEGEDSPEGGHGLRRQLLLEAGDEAQAGGDDLEHDETLSGR